MVLRFLIRYLANNEKLIQALADSYPIRKAARFTARMILQAKYYQEEAFKSMQKANKENLSKTTDSPVSSSSILEFFNEKIQKIKKAFEDERKPR